MFDDLTQAELAALSTMLRNARKDCRKVMYVNWCNAPVIDTYRRMLIELRAIDPLFSS